MGIIKEPVDIDFVVDPRPLSKKERELISAFIKADKTRRSKQGIKPRTITKKRKVSNL